MGRAGGDDGRRRGDLGKDVRCAGDSGPAAGPATPVVRAPGAADGGAKGNRKRLVGAKGIPPSVGAPVSFKRLFFLLRGRRGCRPTQASTGAGKWHRAVSRTPARPPYR